MGAFLVAGLVQGIAGFGAGMVAMALLPVKLSMMEAVPTVSLLWLFVTLAVLSSAGGALASPRVRATLPPLCIGAVLGVPLGVNLLTSVDPRVLRIALGASMLVFVAERVLGELSGAAGHAGRPAAAVEPHVAQPWSALADDSDDVDSCSDVSSCRSPLSHCALSPIVAARPSPSAKSVAPMACEPLRLPMRLLSGATTRAVSAKGGAQRCVDHPLVALLVGLSSGVLSGALNEGGPPVVMYLALRRWQNDEVKATLQAFLLLMSLVGLGVLRHRGLLGAQHMIYAADGLPAAALGIYAGVLVYGRIDQQAFGRLLTVAMLATGVVYIAGATQQLLAGGA